jgi:integrase
LKLILLIVSRAVSLLGLSRRESWKNAEILMLRHQLAVAEREMPRARARLTWPDRAWLALLAGTLPIGRLAAMRLIVTPGTILRWHRDIVRRRWARRSRRGRSGEACGLKWDDLDLDLDEGLAYISRQVQHGANGRLRACPLKTEASRRAVALDPQTVTVLRAHRSWQRRWLSESGITPQGWVFTDDIGGSLFPDCLTRTFNAMVEDSGLPPVRLHDLRHGAATLMLLAGADLKTIADQLGHSSVVLTADTYLSVAVELGLKAAADAARLVLNAASGHPAEATSEDAAHRCSLRSLPDHQVSLERAGDGAWPRPARIDPRTRQRRPGATDGPSACLWRETKVQSARELVPHWTRHGPTGLEKYVT